MTKKTTVKVETNKLIDKLIPKVPRAIMETSGLYMLFVFDMPNSEVVIRYNPSAKDIHFTTLQGHVLSDTSRGDLVAALHKEYLIWLQEQIECVT